MTPAADSPATVLIVSDDSTAAALLGGLVETLGYRVQFAAVHESANCVRRLRPRIAMLDCESDACDEVAIARVIMRGVSVVLVGRREVLARMRDVANRHGVGMVFTPPEPGPLGDELDRAARRPSA